MAAPLYLAGLAYERLVNLSHLFAGLRAVLFVHLENTGANSMG